MTQLNSNLTTFELETLIGDVVAGDTSDYTFLNNPGVAYVSTHEAVAESEDDAVKFTESLSERFTKVFDKEIKPFRYDDSNGKAEYSVFNSLFTTQGGIVRILWLDNKILSVLLGSKPLKIFRSEEDYQAFRQKKVLVEDTTYSAHYFGFTEGCDADLSLSDSDKEKLMALSKTSWLVSDKGSSICPRFEDSCRSIALSKNYVRWGSLEKFIGSDDISFLMYPKTSSYFSASGGNYGSGIPGFVKLLGDFNYTELLDTKLLEGDWNKYREYDNTFFMKDVEVFKEAAKNKGYVKFSYNSIRDFHAAKKLIKTKDLILKKYSILTADDIAKYQDNPRYNITFSADGLLFYVSKSDKLKATALQTKITKSLREEFIAFLNWVGYFQLAADLEPGNMAETFFPAMLSTAKELSWLEKAIKDFPSKKDALIVSATDKYRHLYMGDSTGTIAVTTDNNIFNSVFREYTTGGNRYGNYPTDPLRVFTHQYILFSFNKKFSLNINIPEILSMVARGITKESLQDSSRIYFKSVDEIMSFLTTNFLLSDAAEKDFEKILTSDHNSQEKNIKAISNWSLKYSDNLKDGQLLKTCITLSPEALAIFGSVATLSTPTDVVSWLDLAKDHFTQTLPKQLHAKYSSLGMANRIASTKQISALIGLGIDYYMTIFSAAEPFSNKLLSEDSSETGE